MEISFNTETIRMINFFENITGVKIKDCIIENETNTVYFVVEEGKIRLVIGKNGRIIKNLEEKIKKKIKVFEFSKDLPTFIKKLIPQAKEVRIKNENNNIVVEIEVNKKDRAIVIGRDKRNLKIYKTFLNRFYNVTDLIVK
ncbi:MAG: NusA-like transcription termination signal-binding factor [Candidatus Aenigmatarchaeota archaeon]